MTKCAVVGATGYTGLELIQILLKHPKVELTRLTTRQKDAIDLKSLLPNAGNDCTLQITTYDFEDVKENAEVVFLCLPHTEAAETAAEFRAAGKIVIDLSADFRLNDPDAYDKWYGITAKHAELQKTSAYGLPEFYREKTKQSDLIANPGCYPTSAILALAPLLKEDLIETDFIVIDSKSGYSGAGKKFRESSKFEEAQDNFSAYKVGKHQHTPEIEQTLSDIAGKTIKIAFTTHLLPIYRGILSTIYVKRKKSVKPEQIRKALEDVYKDEPFVRVLENGSFPTLKDVRFTNYCDIACHAAEDSEQVVLVSAIDNLIKGASGQAVQNMNVRMGFSETEGLK